MNLKNRSILGLTAQELANLFAHDPPAVEGEDFDAGDPDEDAEDEDEEPEETEH